ncbi:apolipoprotein L3-like isoform X2 [Seriola lalandi dorsalis]|uniref:apolipoprotein L3-like isoform X2 n=1 Tax=Seriola lalandi dorsalis TaxID=1841481 RepID=UPI000C6F68E1|nr:apolipoprotein L3-like isoform X2 [Seriola lalandi dorsalis]
MSRDSKQPVPMPRNKLDNEASTPQSPTRYMKGGSTPPPVLPKKWTVKKSPGGSETENGGPKIVIADQSNTNIHQAKQFRLPPMPPRRDPDHGDEILDSGSLLVWWKEKKSWDSLCDDIISPRKIIEVKAEHLYKAIKTYILLLTEHAATLKEYTSELQCTADNLNKYSKGTKIAAITGGATTVLGGVAAAAGVILSPVTLGASLALTVVGVGVAAAGGVTGATAAITDKVSTSLDKKKMKKILQEYMDLMKDIISSLEFVNKGMEQLKQHDLSLLCKARRDSARVASMVDLSTTGGASAGTIAGASAGASAGALEANSKAFGMIEGFTLAMDSYYTQGKHGEKMKKGLESKLATKIRKLAEGLNNGLDELIHIKGLFSKHCQGV